MLLLISTLIIIIAFVFVLNFAPFFPLDFQLILFYKFLVYPAVVAEIMFPFFGGGGVVTQCKMLRLLRYFEGRSCLHPQDDLNRFFHIPRSNFLSIILHGVKKMKRPSFENYCYYEYLNVMSQLWTIENTAKRSPVQNVQRNFLLIEENARLYHDRKHGDMLTSLPSKQNKWNIN